MDQEKKYWTGLSVLPGIGPVRFKLLYEYFGSAEAIWGATRNDLIAVNLGHKLTDSFVNFRNGFDIEGYCSKLAEKHIGVVIKTDSNYPKLLQEADDSPFLLYVLGIRGRTPVDLDRTVAVVGTRKVTRYGAEVTEKIVTGLVGYGCTIVSGMAYGVDALAHETALKLGGQTLAVLGCGVDIIAPSSNTGLYRNIISCGRGAVVSEMPLGMRPEKGLFPARNRIISGLSLGVVVTEGDDDSGSLITARYAAHQGRDVFAVPGPITSPYSRGPAMLIKNGAQLVESAGDIVDALGIGPGRAGKIDTGKKISRKYNDNEEKVIAALADGQKHIDEITRDSDMTIPETAATLTVLEMEGIVKDLGEKIYKLA